MGSSTQDSCRESTQDSEYMYEDSDAGLSVGQRSDTELPNDQFEIENEGRFFPSQSAAATHFFPSHIAAATSWEPDAATPKSNVSSDGRIDKGVEEAQASFSLSQSLEHVELAN